MKKDKKGSDLNDNKAEEKQKEHKAWFDKCRLGEIPHNWGMWKKAKEQNCQHSNLTTRLKCLSFEYKNELPSSLACVWMDVRTLKNSIETR